MSEELELTTEELEQIAEPAEGEGVDDTIESDAGGEVDDDSDGASGAVDNDVDDDSADDGVTERARAYGLDPELFESKEALESQMLAIDRQWSAQARQRAAAEQQRVDQQKKAAELARQQRRAAVEQKTVPFKLELDPEVYPPELVEKLNGVLEQVHKHYSPLQQRVDQLNQHIEQQRQTSVRESQQRVVEEFRGSVQALGHKQLFGDGTNTTQAQLANVQKLYAEADSLAAGYQMRGMPVPDMNELVAKAERLAFADELKKYNSQMANARLQKQSRQKLGSGRRRSANAAANTPWNGDPEDNPVLIKKWNEMMEANGER
jgi:hypothetical protein